MENKKQFSGLWAVILGGSSGFGLAAIEKLAKHGMNIALLYRETALAEKALKETLALLARAEDVQILPYNANALDEDSRTAFINVFIEAAGNKQCVKLLLHSIARGNLKPLVAGKNDDGTLNLDEAAILSVDDIQLTTYAMSTSLLDWSRALMQNDLFCGDGRIVGLTSEGAHKYWDSYAAVSIAKASIQSLATYMAVELAKYGIKTNIIQAGITETPSLKRIPGSAELIEFAAKRNPLGRITKTSDVADVIYLLCTDEAFWINGAVIHADGGEHCC